MKTEQVLSVEGLTRSFSGLKAVDGVNVGISRGEVVSIIGPNGSGKTTTLNLITGVLRPDSGTITLGEHRIDRLAASDIAEAGVGRTFQNGRVFGAMTVAENVEVGLHTTLRALRPFRRLSHLPLLRWIPLLAELFVAVFPTPAARREQNLINDTVQVQVNRFSQRLAPRIHDFSYTLSYANRRRTEIARALALQPTLLVLDEPTAGMNQTETQEVLDQLLELKAQGQTMLFVEHKLDLVMTLSDRVIVMDGGKIISQGPPEFVRNDPAVVEAYLGRRRETPEPADVAGRTAILEAQP